MTDVRRSILLWGTALVVLLFASSGILLAQAPDCVETPTQTLDFNAGGNTVHVTSPVFYRNCTGDCCDTITITGVPDDWTVTGQVLLQQVFTTKCENGFPVPLDTIQTIPVNATSDGTTPITIKVCYPATHDWDSFELHTGIQLIVTDLAGNTYPIAVGSSWDVYCQTLGCTPGFWKNHCTLSRDVDKKLGCQQYLVWPDSLTPNSVFKTVFGISANPVGDAGLTLIEALNTGGGDENAMVRHCTSALLNAAWIADQNFTGNCVAFEEDSLTVGEVKQLVQDAYDGSISFESAHQQCAAMNESLCPYNGVWLNTDNGNSECTLTDPGTACNPLP
jgi:hypothetical protein